MVTEARIEANALEDRLVELRVVVQRTENLLKGMASGALGDVAKASTMLSTIEDLGSEALQIRYSDGKELNVDLQTDEEAGDDTERDSSLPASVDALLEQLRDIG